MISLRQLFLVLCLTQLLPVQMIWAADGDVPQILEEGSKFYCLLNAEFGNGLAIITTSSNNEISLNNKIIALTRQIKSFASEIASARNDGDQGLLLKLKNKRKKKKDLKNLLVACQAQVGIFNPEPIVEEPGVETACSIIGNNNSLAASSVQKVSRIINGSACSVGNSPTVELELYIDGNADSACTGTVVNPRTVITAAHCGEGITSVRIKTGAGNVDSNQIFVHPDYNTTGNFQDHDITVVVTNEDIPTRTVNILSTNDFVSGELAYIGGYGVNNGVNQTGAGVLRATTVLLDTFAGDSIGTVYTGEDSNGDTCNGDSGGPLLVKRGEEWLLAGVTSNGNETCTPIDNAYYANLTSTSNKNFVNSIVPGLIP